MSQHHGKVRVHAKKIRFLLAFLGVIGLVLVSQAAEKSLFWRPYQTDEFTSLLYHLDEATPGAEVVTDDKAPGDGPDVAPPEKHADATGRKAANVAAMGDPAELVGACNFVREGRFNGGVRLAGTDGMLLFHNVYSAGWALEGWFRAAQLPQGEATLMHLPGPNGIRIYLRADGTLGVTWLRGKVLLSEWRCTPRQWFHLALVWHPESFDQHEHYMTSADMLVYVNGKPLLHSGVLAPNAFAPAIHAEEVTLGNDADGKSGLDGWLDEVRLSAKGRDYYVPDLDWIDADGTRPAPTGRPFFRDDADLLFWLNFDATLQPARAATGTLVSPKKLDMTAFDIAPKQYAFRFTDGVSKQGLQLRTGEKGVEYTGVGNACSARGTLACWCCPTDWDNYKEWNIVVKWPQEFVPIFTAVQDGQTVLHFEWVKTPDHDSTPNPVDLNPGQWIHVAIAWDGDATVVYINGKPWQYGGSWRWVRKEWDDTKPLQLTFAKPKDRIVIDDFRIYRRMLAPLEIANLVGVYDRRAQLAPLPDFDQTCALNGVLGKGQIRLFPLMADYARVAAATVSITRQGAQTPLGSARVTCQPDSPVTVTVPTPPLDFGTYTVKIAAQDAQNAEIKSIAVPFTRTPPVWWKSTIGMSDKVMPDWTPVQGKDGVISVIGRDIHFAASGLPARVVSAGGEVLAAPIEMSAARNGQAISLTPLTPKANINVVNETRVESSGGLRGDTFTAAISSYTEFDGMSWFTVTLRPDAGKQATLDTFTLRIPLAPDSARLMHWWSGEGQFRSPTSVWIGEVSPTPGVVFRSNEQPRVAPAAGLRGSFIPYLLLTGDKRGLAWFAENDQGWTQSREIPAVSVERTETAVSLVLRVISSPVTLDGPRTFAFGLQAIPVKPLDPAWRDYAGWTTAPDGFSGVFLKSNKGGLAKSVQRTPDNLDWEAVKSRFAQSRFQEMPKGDHPRSVYVPGSYMNLRSLGEVPADTADWVPDWYGFGWNGQWATLRYTQELVDFSSWAFNEWVKRGLFYGLYMDDSWNNIQSVFPGPGAYKLPDGTVQPGFQWLGQREYIRRLRQIFYDNHLTPHMCSHLTHTYYIPYQAFFDVALDGEDFYNNSGETPRDFMDSWSPPRLRFDNPEKWGIAAEWLGWHAGGFGAARYPDWEYRHDRAYTGALLVHDLVWLDEEAAGSTLDYRRLRQSHFLSDPHVTFIPYWDAQGLQNNTQPNLYISAWKREGECLVGMANWDRARLDAVVKFDLKAMGFGDVPADQLVVTDIDHANLVKKFFHTARPVEPDEVSLDGQTKTVNDQPDAQEDEEQRVIKDAAFTWKDGTLSCPVRGHDFRLFSITVKR